MKRTTDRRRIPLRPETIRVLSTIELRDEHVAGGWSEIQTCSLCQPPGGFGCCSHGLAGDPQ